MIRAVVEGVSIEVEEDVHNQRHRVANFMSVLYLPLDEHRVLRADHPGPGDGGAAKDKRLREATEGRSLRVR